MELVDQSMNRSALENNKRLHSIEGGQAIILENGNNENEVKAAKSQQKHQSTRIIYEESRKDLDNEDNIYGDKDLIINQKSVHTEDNEEP